MRRRDGGCHSRRVPYEIAANFFSRPTPVLGQKQFEELSNRERSLNGKLHAAKSAVEEAQAALSESAKRLNAAMEVEAASQKAVKQARKAEALASLELSDLRTRWVQIEARLVEAEQLLKDADAAAAASAERAAAAELSLLAATVGVDVPAIHCTAFFWGPPAAPPRVWSATQSACSELWAVCGSTSAAAPGKIPTHTSIRHHLHVHPHTHSPAIAPTSTSTPAATHAATHPPASHPSLRRLTLRQVVLAELPDADKATSRMGAAVTAALAARRALQAAERTAAAASAELERMQASASAEARLRDEQCTVQLAAHLAQSVADGVRAEVVQG